MNLIAPGHQLRARRGADWLDVVAFELDSCGSEPIQRRRLDQVFVQHIVVAQVAVPCDSAPRQPPSCTLKTLPVRRDCWPEPSAPKSSMRAKMRFGFVGGASAWEQERPSAIIVNPVVACVCIVDSAGAMAGLITSTPGPSLEGTRHRPRRRRRTSMLNTRTSPGAKILVLVQSYVIRYPAGARAVVAARAGQTCRTRAPPGSDCVVRARARGGPRPAASALQRVPPYAIISPATREPATTVESKPAGPTSAPAAAG